MTKQHRIELRFKGPAVAADGVPVDVLAPVLMHAQMILHCLIGTQMGVHVYSRDVPNEVRAAGRTALRLTSPDASIVELCFAADTHQEREQLAAAVATLFDSLQPPLPTVPANVSGQMDNIRDALCNGIDAVQITDCQSQKSIELRPWPAEWQQHRRRMAQLVAPLADEEARKEAERNADDDSLNDFDVDIFLASIPRYRERNWA